MDISTTDRQRHRTWLREITQLPTAAGREARVEARIRDWAREREGVLLSRDRAGNITLSLANAPAAERPVYFTAHMDHPAFVVERVVAPSVVLLSFRGGVMADYFTNARIGVITSDDQHLRGVLTGRQEGAPGPFPLYLAELETSADSVAVGDIARWDFPPAEEIDNCLHTDACDDLAALAAALAAYDVLWRSSRAEAPAQDVRLLFTRAEEIGFIGAIAACRLATIPRGARLLALENSRAFPESPIHAGPIVRVGDRVSVFTPSLTAAVAARAEEVAGGLSTVTASQKLADLPAWKWQRKLMSGGACEASVFCNFGYEATCVCLPLGNYHNMGDLANVQAGANTSPPAVAREFIGLGDYDNLVDLLVACGTRLPESGTFSRVIEKLWNEKSFVLGME